MTETTPRPWWYTGNAADAYKLWLGDRMLFAECGGLGDDAEEFTALIVRAVNNFDALVEALDSIDLSDSTLDDANPDEIILVRRPASVWKRARAALDKAKEA